MKTLFNVLLPVFLCANGLAGDFVSVNSSAAQNAGGQNVLLDMAAPTGGFGGPVLKYTGVNGQTAFMLGGRGGWILNHRLCLGGGGYGVFTEVDAPESTLPLEGPLDIEFGYGGFEIEYIVHHNDLLHYSFYALLGGGASNFVRDEGAVTESNQQAGETDFMLVFEPAVSGEMNVTQKFHLNAGLSYRLTAKGGQQGLKNGDYCGLTASLTFKFGNF